MIALLICLVAGDLPRVEAIKGPSEGEVHASIDRGVAYLLESQNENGSWGAFSYTGGPVMYDPLPGSNHAFRSATTAMCISALIESGSTAAGVEDAIAQAGRWLLDDLPGVRRTAPDVLYNVWSYAYCTQALVRMLERAETDEDRAEIREAIRGQLDRLARAESVDGGWGYYDFRAQTAKSAADSTSFCNAAALVAMKEASDAGIEPDAGVLKRALHATRLQRKPDFSYLYSLNHRVAPMGGINRPGGSLGRSQACNIALRMWGDEAVTDEVLSDWLHRLFARQGWLDIGRKRPVPHESWFAVAGYFYYFGHYYGALCIEALPEAERPFFEAHMAATLLPLQEADGSWFDYPLYQFHKPYGTAFAVMTLVRCR